MSTNSQKPKQNGLSNDPPDWRNTLYQFHDKAVEKYKLKPQEIAIFTTLFSMVKKDGLIQMGNQEVMRKSGISNKTAFKKSRDRLVEAGIITIVKKGTIFNECTLYRIKLMGKPNQKKLERKTNHDE